MLYIIICNRSVYSALHQQFRKLCIKLCFCLLLKPNGNKITHTPFKLSQLYFLQFFPNVIPIQTFLHPIRKKPHIYDRADSASAALKMFRHMSDHKDIKIFPWQPINMRFTLFLTRPFPDILIICIQQWIFTDHAMMHLDIHKRLSKKHIMMTIPVIAIISEIRQNRFHFFSSSRLIQNIQIRHHPHTCNRIKPFHQNAF